MIQTAGYDSEAVMTDMAILHGEDYSLHRGGLWNGLRYSPGQVYSTASNDNNLPTLRKAVLRSASSATP